MFTWLAVKNGKNKKPLLPLWSHKTKAKNKKKNEKREKIHRKKEETKPKNTETFEPCRKWKENILLFAFIFQYFPLMVIGWCEMLLEDAWIPIYRAIDRWSKKSGDQRWATPDGRRSMGSRLMPLAMPNWHNVAFNKFPNNAHPSKIQRSGSGLHK